MLNFGFPPIEKQPDEGLDLSAGELNLSLKHTGRAKCIDFVVSFMSFVCG